MTEPKIYDIESREIHMMGDYVGVCWHKKELREEASDFLTGTKTVTTRYYRTGNPHIGFYDIRHDTLNDEYYVDEDSPVAGGLSVKEAGQVAQELLLAVEYLKESPPPS